MHDDADPHAVGVAVGALLQHLVQAGKPGCAKMDRVFHDGLVAREEGGGQVHTGDPLDGRAQCLPDGRRPRPRHVALHDECRRVHFHASGGRRLGGGRRAHVRTGRGQQIRMRTARLPLRSVVRERPVLPNVPRGHPAVRCPEQPDDAHHQPREPLCQHGWPPCTPVVRTPWECEQVAPRRCMELAIRRCQQGRAHCRKEGTVLS